MEQGKEKEVGNEDQDAERQVTCRTRGIPRKDDSWVIPVIPMAGGLTKTASFSVGPRARPETVRASRKLSHNCCQSMVPADKSSRGCLGPLT